MKEVYRTYFPENAPARSGVAVLERKSGRYPVGIEPAALK